MNPGAGYYRWIVLVITCLLTFGTYYSFDITPLEDEIEEQMISFDEDNASVYYNLLYVVYAWTNCIMSLVAGALVDQWGVNKAAFLFLAFCQVGSALFAAACFLVPAGYVSPVLGYVILFFGRFLFGLGGGPITIAQNAIIAEWFGGKELALAFGIGLSCSRLGSVINFNITPGVYDFWNREYPDYGLGITLACTSGLVMVSLLACVVYNCMSIKHTKWREAHTMSGDEDGEFAVKKKKKIRLADIKRFPKTYWLIILLIAAFYSIVFPFMAVASDYLVAVEKITPSNPSSIVSLTYLVSMFVSPFLGAFVDYFGRRGHIALLGSVLTIPIFVLLRAGEVDPIYLFLALGVSYSVCAAALWPTIASVVPLEVVGTANGVATSVQMFGVGVSNLIVGKLKDSQYSYDGLTYYFIGLGGVCCVLSLALILSDTTNVMKHGKRDRIRANKFKTDFPTASLASSVNSPSKSDFTTRLLAAESP